MASIAGISLVLALVAVAALVIALSPWIPFLRELTPPQRQVVAFNLGVLIASLSPSVVLALLSESSAQGPVSETSLGVVVLSDIAVIVLFAIGSSAAQQVFGGVHEAISPATKLAIEIFGSIAVGALVALAIRLWVRHVRRGLVLFILAVCVVAAEVGSRLHLDPLLINLAAGLILQNVLRVSGEEIAHALEPASLPIFAVFFALAGACLEHGHDPVRRIVSADFCATLGDHRPEFGHRLPQQCARTLALIHEALDQTQVFDLLGRIHPLAESVAQGPRKTVATLPDAQRVLAQAGVALDGGDADAKNRGISRYRRRIVHECILCPRQTG